MSPTILVAGSANLDFVVRAPHIPAPGETVLGSTFSKFPGGKGANQAVACARAGGVSTRFLGAFGDDDLAHPIVASLQSAGVALDAVKSADTLTGSAFICVAANGENAITVVPGANSTLRPEHLPSMAGVTHILMQLETPLPTVQAFARSARAQGVQVVLNAAPAQAPARTLLGDIDVLVVNEGELAVLCGQDGSIATQMQSLEVPVVVTTLGSKGCVAKTSDGFLLQSAYPANVVDTTAAGDTFCGAMVAALACGNPLREALRMASASAALACTRPGAQSSIPSRAEVLALLGTASTPSPQGEQALAQYCGL